MIFSPRIRLKPLAQFCRRMAIATGAGLEDRRIWRDESARGGAAQRTAASRVSDALARGDSIADALKLTADYYPPLFKQVVAVGEVSGQLDRSYRRLADHYDHALTARRAFMSGLAWPAIQLGAAALVVGLVIWISSSFNLKDVQGRPLDMFGLGLIGSRGLAIYVALLVAAAAAVVASLAALRRGTLWTRRLQRLALRVPVIGGALQTLSMAQFTWALQLVLDTPMDLRKALPLALDASGNDFYKQQAPAISRRIAQGSSLHAALAETGAFPTDLMDAIAVGEESGMLAETMERQSREYQERAGAAISVLAQALGYFVWLCVAALIIMLIFRVFSSYTGMLHDLTK